MTFEDLLVPNVAPCKKTVTVVFESRIYVGEILRMDARDAREVPCSLALGHTGACAFHWIEHG